MENTFKEISELIKGGPISGKETIFLGIFDIIFSCTRQKEAHQYFSDVFLTDCLKFLGADSPFNDIVYRTFINIFSEDYLSKELCRSKTVIGDIIKLSLLDIFNKNSKDSDSACMLLSNITREQDNCEQISSYFSPFPEILHKIISAFTTIGYNSSCSLHQLSMVVCNLSQLSEIRSVLTQKDNCLLQKLVPFMNHNNLIRRRGVIGVVHNCTFDSSLHSWLLSNEVDILPRLLLPLAGPEQFDDEDNDKLPVDLQYLPDTKTREPDPEIRKELLETLNQLCATKFGRQFLRDNNSYIILRELHKWEEDPYALLACENVVDILIRTEDEIGIDHLKSVEIPKDLEERFDKVLNIAQ